MVNPREKDGKDDMAGKDEIRLEKISLRAYRGACQRAHHPNPPETTNWVENCVEKGRGNRGGKEENERARDDAVFFSVSFFFPPRN